MKKLYMNIEDIFIKGNPLQLTEVITTMDEALQNVCQATEDITNLVIRYSTSNKGHQFEKMCSTLIAFRDEMYEASLQLNEMQNQIVEYQNKVLRYEGLSESASVPNKHTVNRGSINVDSTEVQFLLPEMMEVFNGLNNYSEAVYHNMRSIVRGKNDIATIWQDSQYNDFAEFIDGLSMDSLEALKVFGEYVAYLDEKIKEMS